MRLQGRTCFLEIPTSESHYLNLTASSNDFQRASFSLECGGTRDMLGESDSQPKWFPESVLVLAIGVCGTRGHVRPSTCILSSSLPRIYATPL